MVRPTRRGGYTDRGVSGESGDAGSEVVVIGGLLGAILALLAVWSPLEGMTGNLPGVLGVGIRVILLILAAVIGFLAGSAVARRARRDREHLGLFAFVTGGVAGGIMGAAIALGVTGAYLAVYGQAPAGISDDVLAALGVAAFGALGFFAGGIAGSVIGGLLGAVLKFAAPGR